MAQVNSAGRRYNEHARFGLFIEIHKADARGQVLDAMAKGSRAGFATLDAATEAQAKFLKLAALTDAIQPGNTYAPNVNFAIYGVTYIVDDRDATVNCVTAIV